MLVLLTRICACLVGFTPTVLERGWCHNKILNWYLMSNKDCNRKDISHPRQRRAVLYINGTLTVGEGTAVEETGSVHV